jgi:hypothetical protein
LRGCQSFPATKLLLARFGGKDRESRHLIDGGNMPSRTLRRGRRPELQANRKIEASREAQPLENKDNAAAISAHLRALIPCSTDPAWLEKMAREVESKAHQR